VDAIRADGLVIEGMRGRHVVRNVRATADARELTSADTLILAVKSYDTAEALASLRHLRARWVRCSRCRTAGKDEALTEAFGRDAVVGRRASSAAPCLRRDT